MGLEKQGFVKIDDLLVVSGADIGALNADKIPEAERGEMEGAGARLSDALIYQSSDGRYAYSPFERRKPPEMSVSERINRILLGKQPAVADEVTKQVLEVTGNRIRAAYIGKQGVTLGFDNDKELVVDAKAGLPAALIDGAELYMEDRLLKGEGDAHKAIKPVIQKLGDKFVPADGMELESFPPEVDDATYAPMRFHGADVYDVRPGTGNGNVNGNRQEHPNEVMRTGIRGVSVELKIDGESYVVGHVANGTGEPWLGQEDELLRAVYPLLDEKTEIKARIVGNDTKPFRAKARATEMALSDGKNGVYLVELCPRSMNVPMDIMENALYAEKNGKGVDAGKRLEEIGPNIGEPSTFMAKLLLDTLERKPENNGIKTVYLDLVTYK